MRANLSPRRGWSALEVLIVVGIVGVIVGILFPAVQSIRESAARTSCANNLKQIGLAIHNYHDNYHCLPVNGGFPPSGQSFNLETDEAGDSYDWGFGNPNRSGIDQPGSWAFSVLPYLDQETAFKTTDYSAALKVYLCPTRGRTTPQTTPERDPGPVFVNWTYQTAGRNPWAKTDYAANASVIPNRGKLMTLMAITDGLTKTILAGEKSMDPRTYNTGGWGWDEPVFTGGSSGTSRTGYEVYRDTPGVAFQYNWGSAHSSVCEFLFADGSVRPICYDVPVKLIQDLLSPQGGEIVDLDQLLQGN